MAISVPRTELIRDPGNLGSEQAGQTIPCDNIFPCLKKGIGFATSAFNGKFSYLYILQETKTKIKNMKMGMKPIHEFPCFKANVYENWLVITLDCT